MQARELTDEALAAAPDNVRVLRLRARLEAGADNHAAAREFFSAASERDPAHLPMLRSWARMEANAAAESVTAAAVHSPA